ncbi:MAG: hypothetical protein EU548_03365 [Promethearchaeota archaeon]|nr:MAG: hypothetical protein EU548_03365 [Candidatus Lokiarchaeota archaeon]
MSENVIENEDGLKIRKLTDLRPTAAEEYQEAMLHRVDYFAKKKQDSTFNSFVDNAVVTSLKVLLEAKVQADKVLGDNRKKVQNIIEKIVLLGL